MYSETVAAKQDEGDCSVPHVAGETVTEGVQEKMQNRRSQDRASGLGS